MAACRPGSPPAHGRAAHDVIEGLSDIQHLDRAQVRFYLQDALALLLATTPPRPLDFLADYFRRVRRGENVVYREVCETAGNDLCELPQLTAHLYIDLFCCALLYSFNILMRLRATVWLSCRSFAVPMGT